MNKENVIYVRHIFSSKKWILAIFNNMDETWGRISQIPSDLICMCTLKRKHTYTPTHKKTKLIDTEKRLIVARGQCWGVGKMSEEDQKLQTSTYKISPGAVAYSMVAIVDNTVLLHMVTDVN